MTFFVDGGADSLADLIAGYDSECDCSYWTSTHRPAHGDGCIPVRTDRLPTGLVRRLLHVAHHARALGALDAWIQEAPTAPSRGLLDRWVADAPDQREQLYRSLNRAVRHAGAHSLPDGFVDLGISVGLARLADAEDLVPVRPELAQRVTALEEDLPRLVADALHEATDAAIPVPSGSPRTDDRGELVAEVTAELGPRLMQEIHNAVNIAVAHQLEDEQ